MDKSVVLQEILLSLNKQQKIAVEFDSSKALQVIAGPGTGKTKVLTSRVAYLLLKKHVSPQDIIVTTFTNKAATEMIDRLVALLSATDVRVSDIMIGTFHSICLKVLSRFGHKIGLRRDWRIIDEKEVDKIIENMIDKMPDQIRDYAHSVTRKVNLCLMKPGTDQWSVHSKLVKREISKLKAFAIIPEEYSQDSEHDPALAFFYEMFQGELNKVNALDFDDLLMHTFRLLTKERCLPYIQHVFVDEFQDTNGIQMDLMFLFARGNHHLSRGITVVGDPDQSIYAFRHALANNFEAMINKCSLESSRVVLVENYRSSQRILNTSETLIKQQIRGRSNRLPLRAQFDCDFPPVYTSFPASFLEAPSLIREILYLKALPNLFTYNDFAILVRQRRQMKGIEKALIEHQIPYKIVRGHGFWELKEAVAIINLLKCLNSDNEKNAIVAALQYPSRGLGKTSAERIKAAIESKDGGALNTLRNISDKIIKVDMPEKARAVVKEFIAMIDACHKLCEGPLITALSEIFEKLYAMSGLRYEYLYLDGKKKTEVKNNSEPDFSNQRHKNIVVLKSYFMGSETSPTDAAKEAGSADSSTNNLKVDTSKRANIQMVKTHIRNFFLSLTMYTSEAEISGDNTHSKVEQEKRGFVTISTIHGAKGLEWPVVFIPGCEEGVIPSIFGEEKDDETDDDAEQSNNAGVETDSKKIITGSPKKPWIISTEETLNEERRMFFVAQTRAKLLLYLSSVDSSDDRKSSSPSRFLTTDVLHTMVDEQKAFDNTESIKKLYEMSNKELPMDTNTFSFTQLIKDYAQFMEKRRERLIWGGSFVHNMYQFDITQNKRNPCISEFTTAAFQLQRTSIQRSPEKNNISPVKHSSPNRHMAPTKTSRTDYRSPTGSPIKRGSFAPDYRANREDSLASFVKEKSFAPKIENQQLHMDKNSPPVHLDPLKERLVNDTCGKEIIQSSRNYSMYKAFQPRVDSIKKEEGATLSRANHSKPLNFRNKRKLIAAPIDIAASDESLKGNIKDEGEIFETSHTRIENGLDTTAAEILHNPEDMIVDDRPIIASAKTLADAVKRANKCEQVVEPSSQSSSKSTKSSGKGKIKTESASNDLDIFSQLSRAKKKAKLNDVELIIID